MRGGRGYNTFGQQILLPSKSYRPQFKLNKMFKFGMAFFSSVGSAVAKGKGGWGAG
jgi:hypothetical protein